MMTSAVSTRINTRSIVTSVQSSDTARTRPSADIDIGIEYRVPVVGFWPWFVDGL